ncbi:MAG: glycosyltransferase family 39 protein [Acidobacteriota bacterium]
MIASPEKAPRIRPAVASVSVAVASALIFVRCLPLGREYASRFSQSHGAPLLAAALAGGAAALAVATLLLWTRPKALVLTAFGLAAVLLVTSGNAGASAAAVLLLAAVLVLGDLVFRIFTGIEAEEGDASSVFAAGVAASGILFLALGEVGILRPGFVAAMFAALALWRRRRPAAIFRILRRAAETAFPGPLRVHEALWLAIAGIVLFASFVSALGPEVSFDALAYHLPEARDTALKSRVEALPDILPQSLFWRNHQTFLSSGFLFGGERVARLLHYFVALGAFGAALSLARRLYGKAAGPLVCLALTAVPVICMQFHSVSSDWPAAFLVTAAASEIAGADRRPSRSRLAGFLFGAALATKVFAALALPALLVLFFWKVRRGTVRRLLLAAACAVLALLPWLAWSQSRAGFWLAPYASSFSALVSRSAPGGDIGHGIVLTSSAAVGERQDSPSPAGFLRLPYDLTFHGVFWERIPDGYNGMLPLLLLIGALGLGPRKLALFLMVAFAAVLPWYLLRAPALRYLFPVYPLYAVFAAKGLHRLTANFEGAAGRRAGVAIAAVTLAFPAQFLSLPFDARVAVGRVSRESALASYLPGYPLWKLVTPADRVLLAGEFDRYHCPAERAWRTGWWPVSDLPASDARWAERLRRLRVTHCMVRTDLAGSLPLPESAFDLVGRRGSAALYRVRPTGSSRPLPLR